MWTQEQCRRLAFEEAQVKNYFPQFDVRNRTLNTYYIGLLRAKGYRNKYELKLSVLSRFPNEAPKLYVMSPRILRMYKGRGTINALVLDGPSHSYHVNRTPKKNPVEICYSNSWNASCSCVQAIWRGWIWTAAYEVHLITGRTIADIIDEWRRKLRGRVWI